MALGAELDLIERELDAFRCVLSQRRMRVRTDIEGALLYIHEHLFNPGLSIGGVRRELCLRNNNFASQFRRCTGHSPWRYIQSLRVEAAMRLLGLKEVPIYLVAFAVGYESPEAFTRAFGKRVGMNPAEFRASVVLAESSKGNMGCVVVRGTAVWNRRGVVCRGP
jgi:two-component system, response regulator YesN